MGIHVNEPGVTNLPFNCKIFTPGSFGIDSEVENPLFMMLLLKTMSTGSLRMLSPSKSVAFRSKIASFCPLDGFQRGLLRVSGTGEGYCNGDIWKSRHFCNAT
jgi:hypothetical protein